MKRNLFFVLFILLSCGSESEDSLDNCMQLQKELTEANLAKAEALIKYAQDPSTCAEYNTAIRNNIMKAEAMLNADCLTEFSEMTTRQAIEEDEDELQNINC